MKVDTKKFFLALGIFIVIVAGVGIKEYNFALSSNISNIEQSLNEAAISSALISDDHYIKRLFTGQITPVESASDTERLTSLAKYHQIRHLYTLVLDNDQTFRYAVGSLNTIDGTILKPLDPITNNLEELKNIIGDNKPLFKLDNEKGEHVFYLPKTTPEGYKTLTVVISESVSLQKLSQAAFFDTFAKSLLILLGILPFLLLYRSVIKAKTKQLSEEVAFTSEKLNETSAILQDRVEEKTKELVDEGFIDPLTHLPNRYRLIYDMDRNDYRALIIVHIQNLHDLNHFFGSSITDSLRQQFALFLNWLNLNAYRLGRDEFALLLHHDSTKLDAYISYLLSTLDAYTFNVQHEKINLTVHMGIDASDRLSLSNADEALAYAHKHELEFSIYEEDKTLKSTQNEHLSIATSIREAYFDGRLICYFQPMIHTATGEIYGYETLARLIDKDASIISPLNFLPIAQKTALYPEISREIIGQACKAFESRSEHFSINITHFDMQDSRTLRFIEEAIVSTNTSNRIIFDISEADLHAHYSICVQFISRMKQLGVKIAIDNFGETSIDMMKLLELEIDYFKIDDSLISKLNQGKKYIRTLEAIQLFATTIGATTIAKHIESDEIYRIVQSSNIDYAQGFHIGHPTHLN